MNHTCNAPEWVRTSDPVIRSSAHYFWTTAPVNWREYIKQGGLEIGANFVMHSDHLLPDSDGLSHFLCWS